MYIAACEIIHKLQQIKTGQPSVLFRTKEDVLVPIYLHLYLTLCILLRIYASVFICPKIFIVPFSTNVIPIAHLNAVTKLIPHCPFSTVSHCTLSLLLLRPIYYIWRICQGLFSIILIIFCTYPTNRVFSLIYNIEVYSTQQHTTTYASENRILLLAYNEGLHGVSFC